MNAPKEIQAAKWINETITPAMVEALSKSGNPAMRKAAVHLKDLAKRHAMQNWSGGDERAIDDALFYASATQIKRAI